MSSGAREIRWVIKIGKLISKELGISFKVEQNGHLKLYFYDEHGRHCMIPLSKTPSCSFTRYYSIDKIRTRVKEVFGFELDKSLFSMQLYRCQAIH